MNPKYPFCEGGSSPSPSTFSEILQLRHELTRAVRDYFYNRGYIEVETPNLMRTAAPDPNIDPLEVFVGGQGPYYLHTSPEMGMKKLLPHSHGGIFQICKVYRVEEFEEIHNVEFTMLEWYRKGTYLDAMDETKGLVQFAAERLQAIHDDRYGGPWKVYDLADLFVQRIDINPFDLGKDDLLMAMRGKRFMGIDERDSWNDLFFKLFIQEVEPHIPKEDPYFIRDWPLSVSTMAKRRDANRVERFELYINGLEIANGYTELLDYKEQTRRFEIDNNERKGSGRRAFGVDEEFLEALSVLQPEGSYAGVSVGVDRLLMVLLGKERIADVMVQRFRM
ncbi:MAG: Elongation factor P--(R)-beta-lysine ligase [Syntrophorhabdus sp. PtaU1.Bin153]|nr:MAG: Elongation factor P--(R)-beta-lysine ligase [Syntrophorhabdus sp. PtaU1.Bin153]